MSSKLERAEAATAAFLTLAAVWLHVLAARSAGGLWRDEANTVGLATLPTLDDVWQNLQFDSFPILWILVVRQLSALFGPMNDPVFRLTGLLIGLLGLASLWLNARVFGHRYPLVSLALLGLAPSVIRWGDSFRAYGLGIALILTTLALLFRYVRSGGPWTLCLLALTAMVAVHTTFYNAPGLLAMCSGAVVVCGMRGDWRKAATVVSVGAFAAISLYPYVGVIQAASEWNSLVHIPDFSLTWFIAKLHETLAPGGSWSIVVWIVAYFFSLWAALRALSQDWATRLDGGAREAVTFVLVSVVSATVLLYFFLRILSYVTQPWYYLTLLAIAAVSIDSLLGAVIQTVRARLARLIVVASFAVLTIVAASTAVRVQKTNVDSAASMLGAEAQHGDLIVVSPWYVGVSFDRYYRGAATWLTVPEIGFHRYHRYDMLAAAMQDANQSAPVTRALSETSKALKNGHSVFMVGGIPSRNHAPVPLLKPARLPADGPKSGRYEGAWTLHFADYLYRHATTVLERPVPNRGPISDYEEVRVIVAKGWKD